MAEVNPRLLSTLAQSYDDERHFTTNESHRAMLNDFSTLNAFGLFVNTKQEVGYGVKVGGLKYAQGASRCKITDKLSPVRSEWIP